MDMVSAARACSYLARALAGQQRDALCSRCKAFANTVAAARELFKQYEARMQERGEPSGPATAMVRDAQSLLSGLELPVDAAGQKKAGNCMLPPGHCFVKSSLAFFRALEEQTPA